MQGSALERTASGRRGSRQVLAGLVFGAYISRLPVLVDREAA